jgi:hypothetical protein
MGQFKSTIARESIREDECIPQKKIQGFAHVFTLEKF